MSNSDKVFKYKGVSTNMFGIPGFLSGDKKKKGSHKTKIKRNKYMPSFTSELKTDTPKNLLLIYDIPEAMKKERDWFRRQLKSFDFIMIQRSAWVGPSPLPKDFTDYVERIGLKKQFKTFKLAKAYTQTS